MSLSIGAITDSDDDFGMLSRGMGLVEDVEGLSII
jgi:hypothetical protein